MLITILEPPSLFSSLILLCSSLISKIPTKNSPNFFVICWFDEVLLDLIDGFAWFQVDLESSQVSPSFIHEISSILTPKSPFSAQNRAPELASRIDPDPPDDRSFTDVRSPRNNRTSDLFRTTGTPNPNRIYGFPTFRDVRRPGHPTFPDVRNL